MHKGLLCGKKKFCSGGNLELSDWAKFNFKLLLQQKCESKILTRDVKFRQTQTWD